MGEGRDYEVGGYITRPLADAVSITKDHLVLEIDANGELILGTAAGTPYGVSVRSTQNKVARTAGLTQFDTGADIDAEIPVMRSGIVELELGSTNIAIAIGDRIVVHADDNGTVNGAADIAAVADILLTVGYAEEVKALDAGGTVLVSLALERGGGP